MTDVPPPPPAGSDRTPSLLDACIPAVALIVFLATSYLLYGDKAAQGPNQIALLFCGLIACGIAVKNGVPWSALRQATADGIASALSAIFILLAVGALIGTWALSGTIATMVYYGLQVLSPHYFYASAALICAVVATGIGSSWTVAGTIGIGLIGIAGNMGLSPEITAGAVISGAYFGDKASPLSDTVNLAAAASGSDLFQHTRESLWTSIPALLLSLIGFAIRDPQTEAHFQSLILQVFPGSAQPELEKALGGVKQSVGWLSLVSLGGLLWSASSIFATMEFALTEIFGTPQRDMLRQRLMGLVMMLLLVVAIVLTVAINAGTAFFQLKWISTIIGFIAGAAVMVALLVALYRFVPNRTFRLSDVLPGALLAGVGIEVLSLAFPLYASIAHGFNTYGAQFALFFLLATWFYLLSQLVLLGAVYNKFRLGEPETKGIIASPLRESRQKEKAAATIEQKKAEAAPPPRPRRSVFQRAALGVVVALALAAGVVRRRRPRSAV